MGSEYHQEPQDLPVVAGGADDYAPEREAKLTAAVLTVSTSVFDGESPDDVGPQVAEFLESEGYEIAATAAVSDDVSLIQEKLTGWSDLGVARLIVTVGGTGLAPTHVTPEATREVLDKEIPGIPEAMRARSDIPRAVLHRQLAGVRGRSLVLNLPGSAGEARENLIAVMEVIEPALDAIAEVANE